MDSPFVLIALCLLLYTVYGIVYRLYLSPIAKFPGPKLAALTQLYEFYYNIVQDGQFIWELERMHKKYGAIVRINPWEIHVADPEFYDVLYAGRGRDKYAWFYAGGASPQSTVETLSHTHHRLRRSALNPFFSKRNILTITPLLKSKIHLLCSNISAHFQESKPIELRQAFTALTLDVISSWCFGRSFGCLEDTAVGREWYISLTETFRWTNTIMFFPWVVPFALKWCPDRWAGPVVMHHRRNALGVARILSRTEEAEGAPQNTIFHELRDSDVLPPSEKTLERLQDEGNILIGAGSETTANALAVMFCHVHLNKNIKERLMGELWSLSDEDAEDWRSLEKLPYLTAVINETLRISSISIARLPRIANEDLIFKKWTVPAGTPISMSYHFIHHNPAIFPFPSTFDPSRWLTENGNVPSFRYLVPFSKGSRMCVGTNLAYAQLYLTTAMLLKRFNFELYETDASDVEIARDHLVAVQRKGSQGVRVMVVDDIVVKKGEVVKD